MSKSRSVNKVILMGNLTRNPVLRETNNGALVCTFGIATNKSWKDKNGEYRESAEYHNLIAFDKLAEICANLLSVGMSVYTEGEIRNREVIGGDGKKYYRPEIKLNDMIVSDAKGKKGIGIDAAFEAGKRSRDNDQNEETHENAPSTNEVEEVDDGLKSEDLF